MNKTYGEWYIDDINSHGIANLCFIFRRFLKLKNDVTFIYCLILILIFDEIHYFIEFCTIYFQQSENYLDFDLWAIWEWWNGPTNTVTHRMFVRHDRMMQIINPNKSISWIIQPRCTNEHLLNRTVTLHEQDHYLNREVMWHNLLASAVNQNADKSYHSSFINTFNYMSATP